MIELFNQHSIPPSQGQLDLLRYLLVLTYAVHLPYLGLVIGATSLSLAFNARDRDIANPTFARMAKDLMDMVIPNHAAVIVFGVLPLVVLWLIYGQWLSGSGVTAFYLLPLGAFLIAFGFLPVLAYRRSLLPEGRNANSNFGVGSLGLLIMLVGTFVVIGATTRFNDPERWFLAHGAIRWLLSFNVIWKFGYFLVSAVALTGCGILFFFFSWRGKQTVGDAGYTRFLKNFGAGVALAATLLIPVMGFFYLVTTPLVAISGLLYGVATATLILLFVIFVYLYGAILSAKPKHGAPAFILFLLVFLLTAVGDQLTLVNATQEHSAALVQRAEERKAQMELDRAAREGAAMVVSVARGEEVFNTICITCHRMDERLVGPPLNSVLGKYEGKRDELESFILAPKKIDPAYPPMPAPGLPLGDVRSVAAYLLGETDSGGAETETPKGH